MRSRRSVVPYCTGHLSQQELLLVNSIRDCFVLVERLSDEFIENAITRNNFASEKKKPKKIKTKRRGNNSECRKRQKKRKYIDNTSEEESDESDEDFVVSSCPSPTERRVLRSDGVVIENEFEPTVSKELFSCKNCAFVTNTQQHLLHHSSRHKNICSFCQRQFGSNAECETHLAEAHTPNVEKVITYKCKKCKENFNLESEYKSHLLSHLDTSPENSHLDTSSEKFSCCFCRSLFAKYTNLVNHVQRTHIEYKCTFCDISAPKFEILERHCQTLHAYWGRPFECEYCDFKFAVFGCLQSHRSEHHAIEWYDGEDKCRFCHVVLGNQESRMEHFAKHVQVPLFKCYLCEFCSNIEYEMKEHSKEEHSKSEIFAKQVEIGELMELVKHLIKKEFTREAIEIKQPRQKPTAVETREAIAAILSSEETLNDFDVSFEANGVESNDVITEGIDYLREENESRCEKNCVAVDVDGQQMVTAMKSSISTLVKPSENTKRETLQTGKRKGRKRKKQKLESKQKNEKQSEENGNIEAVDPFEAETDVEDEQKERAVMSVDPITNRLYVNGLPVFDEAGNEVYVVSQFVE